VHSAIRVLGLAFALVLPALSQAPFAWKDLGDGRIELREAGKLALVYNYGPQLKPGAPENRRRCCYFFPVYTPAEVSVLDDFPADHWHHRGLFWSWPIVETEGQRYDIWMNFTAKHRTVKPPVVAATKEATFQAENVWEAGGKDIVRETVRVRVLPTQGTSRELELELTWEALGAPVTLQGSAERGKSYGGLSTRFAPRQGTILRADGVVLTRDEDLNPHHWAEMEGIYGGKRAVLRITSDEKNPGAPYQWCLRAFTSQPAIKTLGDGRYAFIGASFPGRTEQVDRYTLERGKPWTIRFRVRLTDLP
jgi:hypothetical protein